MERANGGKEGLKEAGGFGVILRFSGGAKGETGQEHKLVMVWF